jgi:hypothetical protein
VKQEEVVTTHLQQRGGRKLLYAFHMHAHINDKTGGFRLNSTPLVVCFVVCRGFVGLFRIPLLNQKLLARQNHDKTTTPCRTRHTVFATTEGANVTKPREILDEV